MKTIKKTKTNKGMLLGILLITFINSIIVSAGGDTTSVINSYGINIDGRTKVIHRDLSCEFGNIGALEKLPEVAPIPSEDSAFLLQTSIDFIEDLAEEQRRIAEEKRLEAERLRKIEEERKRKEQIRLAKERKIKYINNIKNPIHINSCSGLTVEHMAMVLDGTGLAGTEEAFYILDREGINFFYAVANSIQESGWNTNSPRAINKNDIFGITSLNRDYNSKQECIDYFGDFIQRLYIDQGLTTVEAINPKYCPTTNRWSSGIRSIMSTLHQKALDTSHAVKIK